MGAVEIGWTLAGVGFSGLLAGWTFWGNSPAGWVCFAASVVPVALMTGVSIHASSSIGFRITLSLLVGGVTGAVFLVGLVEAWHARAKPPIHQEAQIASNGPNSDQATQRGDVQSSQSGNNFSVPGSGNTFNIYPPVPSAITARDLSSVYQAGSPVGKAFGGRRSPTDATVYTFVEITNASQLNTRVPIEYDGLVLQIKSVRSRIGLMVARPEAGTIYEGVTAAVIGVVR